MRRPHRRAPTSDAPVGRCSASGDAGDVGRRHLGVVAGRIDVSVRHPRAHRDDRRRAGTDADVHAPSLSGFGQQVPVMRSGASSGAADARGSMMVSRCAIRSRRRVHRRNRGRAGDPGDRRSDRAQRHRVLVRGGRVPGGQRPARRAVPVVWPLQQLGALLVGPVVAIVALVLRRSTASPSPPCSSPCSSSSASELVKAVVSRERPARRSARTSSSAATSSGRRELRLRARRPRRRPGRRRHAVPPGRWKVVPWVLVRRGHVRAGVRRRPQPARRHLWGRRSASPSVVALNLGLGVATSRQSRRRRRRRSADGRWCLTPAGAARSAAGGRRVGVRRTTDRRDHRRLVRLHRERRPRRGLQPGTRGGRVPGRAGVRARAARVRRSGARRRADRVAARVRRYGGRVPQPRSRRTDRRRRRHARRAGAAARRSTPRRPGCRAGAGRATRSS